MFNYFYCYYYLKKVFINFFHPAHHHYFNARIFVYLNLSGCIWKQ
jgi:hypothetical protein